MCRGDGPSMWMVHLLVLGGSSKVDCRHAEGGKAMGEWRGLMPEILFLLWHGRVSVSHEKAWCAPLSMDERWL